MGLTPCRYQWLGRMDYPVALDIQRHLVEARGKEGSPDSVLFLEHSPAYTLGRGGDQTHLLVSEERLTELGAFLYRVDRGGDITFHGPGQLVGYPILDLNGLGVSVSGYVRGLEEVLIRALSVFDLAGERLEGFPGVWVGKEKIAAIGVKVNAGRVTSHGFALNVNNDLEYFSHIIPCGLNGKGVTSLARIRRQDMLMSGVMEEVIRAFGCVFGMVMKKKNFVAGPG